MPSADKESSESGRKIRIVPQARQNSAAVQPVMLLSRYNVRVGVVPGMMLMYFASLQSGWDNIVDGKLPFRLRHAEKLPVTFPQVEKKTERRQPDLLRRKMQLRRSVIEKPGEQFLVC